MSSTFCPDTGQLQRALAGDLLSPEQAEGLARHLETCAECAALLQRLPDEDRLLSAARAAALRPGGPPLTGPLAALVQRLKALSGSTAPGAADTSGSGSNTPAPEDGPAENLDPPQAPDELGRIGPYRVLRVLGAGGMGVVYLAEDPRLKRRVALKLMGPALAANPAARRRFQREAEAMAAVEHDHIVTVYQVGEHRGAPFLAMPLLKGESLEARLKREPRLPLAELLRIGREIAEGLAAAHEKGLIHRDVKPGNLWLEEGRGRVKVLDFGLARPVEGSADLTHGMVVGTPAYMAPEQATARPVDHRCDLFSLGCVLYRMATGEPPFRGDTPWEVLHAVTHAEPPPPHRKRPDLPLPLSSFIQRLLSKDRDKRPASAHEVIGALTAVARKVEQTPAEAPPATLPELRPAATAAAGPRPRRSKKWLAAAALLLALGGAGAYGVAQIVIRIRDKDGRVTEVTTDQPVVIEKEKDKTVIRVGEPKAAPPKPPDKERTKSPAVVDKPKPPPPVVEKSKPPAPKPQPPPPDKGRPKAPAVVDKPKPPSPDEAAGVIDDVIRQIARRRAASPPAGPSPLDSLRPEKAPAMARKLAGAPPELVAVLGDDHLRGKRIALSPDGKRIAAVAPDCVLIGQAQDGAVLQMLRWSPATRGGGLVRYSPDGKYLAGASFGTVILWDAQTGVRRREFKGKKIDGVECLAFSPDGRRLAFTSSYSLRKVYDVIVWDLATDEAKQLQGHTADVHGVCFSPDGRRLASVAGQSFRQGELIVWDVASGTRAYGKADYKSDIQKVAYSPDGKLLALGHGYSSSAIRLLDAATGAELRELKGHEYAITDLAFEPKGHRLASAGRDNTVRLWDADTGGLLLVVWEHAGEVNSVCFSRDGRWLLSAGSDQRVLGYDLTNGKKLFQYRGHTDPIVDLAVSLDGKRLASVGESSTLRWWDLATGEEAERLPVRADAGLRVFAPGGLLVTGRDGGPGSQHALTVWDGRKGAQLRDLKTEPFGYPRFSPDGRYVACQFWESGKRPVKVWDLRDGRLLQTLSAPEGEVDNFAFLPDGSGVAVSAGKPGAREVVAWDIEKGKPVRPLAAIRDCRFGKLSPDGRRMVIWGPGRPGRVQLQAVTVGGKAGAVVDIQPPEVPGYGTDSPGVGGWSPDGRYLAGTYRGTVVVWDADTGKPRLKIPLAVRVERVLFAPDGRHLIAGTGLGWIYVLRLPRLP